MLNAEGFQPFIPRVVSGRMRSEVPDRGPSEVDSAASPDQQSGHQPSGDEPAREAAAIESPSEVSVGLRADGPPSKLNTGGVCEDVSSEMPLCDEERCAGFIRERAIKLAGEACARALREAIARNPLFVARFVDAAIEAGGRAACKRVRLPAADAASCSGGIALDVVTDERLATGDVVVETTGGTIEATIDRRALLLVRAAADQ